MQQLSAPIFEFGEPRQLSADDAYIRDCAPLGQLAMTGPGIVPESGNLPVRGDLAHIRLAGKYFVPHYAVPMPRVVLAGGATVRAAGDDDAPVVCTLAAGEIFNVLDIAGQWAWGQVGEDGFVGYLPIATLEERRS